MTDVNDLLQRLDREHRDLLHRCGEAAAGRSAQAYLVGGSVRDLLLRRPHDDLDVVVVGDGLGVAQDVARAVKGVLTRHHAFQTATVMTPAGPRLDLATARREDYPRPGQLPRVVAGSLAEDLERRDFTINAMALSLQTDDYGAFVDPEGGWADLQQRLLRVMHRRSFADDPTRILRALRFAVRFGYALEPETHLWLSEAVTGGYLAEVSGDRVRKELRLTLGEAPVEGPLRLQEEGVLDSLQPGLRAEAASLRRLQGLIELHGRGPDGALQPPAWTLVLATCAASMPQQERWLLVRRLRLSREERGPLLDAGAPWRKALDGLSERSPDSAVERAFRTLSRGALLAAASTRAEGDPVARMAGRYLERLSTVRPELDGDALKALGVPMGPEIGEYLERLRAARLDGDVTDAAGERRLVAAWLAAESRE